MNLRALAKAATQPHNNDCDYSCLACQAQGELGDKGELILAMQDVIDAAKAYFRSDTVETACAARTVYDAALAHLEGIP